jgi:hypothetical protein
MFLISLVRYGSLSPPLPDRIALQVGDLSELNTCLSRLAALHHRRPALAAATLEFACYGLLYAVVTKKPSKSLPTCPAS